MPFKSMAQRRKFYALKDLGKMNQKTIDEWEKDTPEDLPERMTKKAEVRSLSRKVLDVYFDQELSYDRS